ncbi:MAG: hypothetical protein WD771_05555 [Gemmatimonadaceae bacterium]
MRIWVPILALGAALAGCERRPAVPPADDASADTISAGDSVGGVDSVRSGSAAVTGRTPPRVDTTAALPEIIGYDSAFGPLYEVDSTGKLVPIRPRRP